MWRTFREYKPVPANIHEAAKQGWAPETGNVCLPNLGHRWSLESSGPSESNTIALYFTPAGQIAGVGAIAFGAVEQGYWKGTDKEGVWRVDVTFRSAAEVCSRSTSPLPLGDRAVINADTSLSHALPMRQSATQQRRREVASDQNSTCARSIGAQAPFDLLARNGSSAQARPNLMPVVPLYDPSDGGSLYAIFFAVPSNSVGPTSVLPLKAHTHTHRRRDVGGREPSLLAMCTNFCSKKTTGFPDANVSTSEATINSQALATDIGLLVLGAIALAIPFGFLMQWAHQRHPIPPCSGDEKSEVMLADKILMGTRDLHVTPDSDAASTSDIGTCNSQPDAIKPNPAKARLLRTVMTEWIVPGILPYWCLPGLTVFSVLGATFVFPAINDIVTKYDSRMALFFLLYISIDLIVLRWTLGVIKWRLYLWLGFSPLELTRLAGPYPVIPTAEWLARGGSWMYQCDSLSRKLPHVLHWVGLAHFAVLAAEGTSMREWSTFQFTVMGATCDIVLMWLFARTTNFFANMLVWLPSIRTADGFARRMNNLYCKCSSVVGMGVTVPVSAWLLSAEFGAQHHTAFIFLVTLPCAYGDCLAEIIGVNGRVRFDVYGLGEINNKSVEGMLAMFLGSVLPSLPYADAVGGWPYLLIVGVFATVAETWSPRGFDNITIPAFSALGVLVSCLIHRSTTDASGSAAALMPMQLSTFVSECTVRTFL